MIGKAIFLKFFAVAFLCCASICSYSQSADTNGIAAFRVGKKWGIIDHRGTVVCAPKYDGIDFYKNLGTYFESHKLKYGLLRLNGEALTPAIYNEIVLGDYGLHSFSKGRKWGYLNDGGIEQIAPAYDEPVSFKEDRAIVKIDGKNFLIDREGKIIVAITGLHYFFYTKDSIFVSQDSSAVLIDHNGKTVRDFPFFINSVDGRHMVVYPSSPAMQAIKAGVADMDGHLLIQPEYYDITLCDDLFLVHKMNQIGYVDVYNRTVVPFDNYQYLHLFSEGYFFTEYKKRNDKAGLVSRSGKDIGIEFEEAFALPFNAGVVKKNGKWGCIDTTGKWILPLKYDNVYVLGPDHFWVWKGKKKKLINSRQKRICKVKLDRCDVSGKDTRPAYRIVVVKGDKYGVIDANGNFVVPLIYDEIKTYSWY